MTKTQTVWDLITQFAVRDVTSYISDDDNNTATTTETQFRHNI